MQNDKQHQNDCLGGIQIGEISGGTVHINSPAVIVAAAALFFIAFLTYINNDGENTDSAISSQTEMSITTNEGSTNTITFHQEKNTDTATSMPATDISTVAAIITSTHTITAK